MSSHRVIFVVDDDPVINTLIVNRFTAEGYVVEAFTYGEDCLETLCDIPDLVILDYFFMKEGHNVMGGMEIFNRIRELRPDLPVIILSGQDKGEVVLELARKGIDDYVIKDVNLLDNLSAAIRNVFERKG